jgi:Ca-activated chloride channel family protein
MIFFIIFIFFVLRFEKSFFNFVRDYWFLRRSFLSVFSTFFYVLGMGGILLSLLDLRGPEQKIKTPIPKTKTIILLDTSASMLAEDIKPSRIKKAVLIAKHFARKALGQQLSIVAFAEIQKKIVPFTADLDLIDSRLESLENLRNHYGSSALSFAIQESIQYFKELDSESYGNIIVLTDGEETTEGIDLKIPKNIKVAMVGIGTSQGGKIPIDDGRGFRIEYKKERGREVITKLNESFFKQLSKNQSNIKYWLATSYVLPSDEILNFFRGEQKGMNEDQDMTIRPVLMEWILIPSLLLLVLSYFLKSLRIFAACIFLVISPVKAENDNIKLSADLLNTLDSLQSGKLNILEKIKLADDLYKSGSKEDALSLYEENLPKSIDLKIPSEAYLNYGTALLEKGEVSKALSIYKSLSQSLDNSLNANKIKDLMNKNTLSFFRSQMQQEKEKNQKDSEKRNDNSKPNEQKNHSEDNSEGSRGSQKNKDKLDEEAPKGGKNTQKGNEGDEKNNKKDKKNEDKEKKENQIEKDIKPLPPKKVPAKLKQLMSDDRQLQMKMIEKGTKDLNRINSNKSKDW